jgi:putative ubiquitin-RnfH superfamily antitoxin RatB of RatAB toxin-antitoxin module
MAPAESIAVVVAFCPAPGQIDQVSLRLPRGSTLQQALLASGVLQRQGLRLQQVQAGIWGRLQGLDTVLRERDRVELYRPLQVDPKEARRLRYGRHKAAVQARKAASAAQATLERSDGS